MSHDDGGEVAPGDPRGAGDRSDVAPPGADVLASLDADRWAVLLPHVRAALADLEGPQRTAAVARLQAAPTARLAAGRMRRDLCTLLAQGGPAWRALHTRLAALDPVPSGLRWLVDGAPPPEIAPPSEVGPQGPAPAPGADRDEIDRLRSRLRELRAERDQAARRAEGEQARAATLERERDEARQEAEQARDDLAAARAELAGEQRDRNRAVERERRRRDAEVAGLERELATLRREQQERQAQDRRREQERRERPSGGSEPAGEPRGPVRLVPGRPSQLPPDVARGTTEAADLLLHDGRLVLVDGYNLTLQHRPQLDLEAQRAWLVSLLTRLAAQRRIRPTVVFDGERAAGARSPSGARGVSVVFTAGGITADDELVLAVEGTDEPVVVVTDDRELIARVTASGADVIGTRSFLGVAG